MVLYLNQIAVMQEFLLDYLQLLNYLSCPLIEQKSAYQNLFCFQEVFVYLLLVYFLGRFLAWINILHIAEQIILVCDFF